MILFAWLYRQDQLRELCVAGDSGQEGDGDRRVADVYGQRLSFARSTTRYFSKILSALLLGIGYLMAFFTADSQALHDKIASTVVVNASELPADPEPVESVRVVSLLLVLAMVGIFGGLHSDARAARRRRLPRARQPL